MEKKFIKIVQNATSLFKKYGVKSVTMDDLARELGISKKTLYKYVSDKTDLIDKCVESYLSEHKKSFASISEKKMNAIDTLLSITRYMSVFMSDLNLSVTYDIQKYYPKAWKKISDFKREHSLEKININIRQGQEQGLYKRSINPDIISVLYCSCMDAIFYPEFEKNLQFTVSELVWEAVKYHIRGIASKKGLDYFEEKLKEELNRK